MLSPLWRWSLACLVLLAVGFSACTSAATPSTRVKFEGTVYGEAMSLASMSTVALAATVTCNGISSTAKMDGTFTFSVPRASHYECTASLSPMYRSVEAALPAGYGDTIKLIFASTTHVGCWTFPSEGTVECADLQLQNATVHGLMKYSDGSAVTGGIVYCANTSAVSDGLIWNYTWPEVQSNDDGSFSYSTSRAGQIRCLARSPQGAVDIHTLTVQPGANVALDFTLCKAHCPPVTYHNGPIMHTQNDYLIFWLPKGKTFEPFGSSASFESLVQRYFRDIGGSSFYGMLSQYYDALGAAQNTVHLGGVWVDSMPYQHCVPGTQACVPAAATHADPLDNDDIQSEIVRAFQANPSWHSGAANEFFVFTGAGAEECDTASRTDHCSYSDSKTGFCAYHSTFDTPSVVVQPETIYAYVPSAANPEGLCSYGGGFEGPNRDNVADITIDFISHEQFESVTNPDTITGWFDGNPDVGEIGDKCYRSYGALRGDNSNITLNGHDYLVQPEWSNRANRCSFS